MPPKILLYITSIIRTIFWNNEENLAKTIDTDLFGFGFLPIY